MPVSFFPVPSRDLEDQRKLSREQSLAIQGIMQGRTNNILEVTLTPNATTTTINDSRIGLNTAVICLPMTAAAAATSLPYRDYTTANNGSLTLVHASESFANRTFKVVLIG